MKLTVSPVDGEIFVLDVPNETLLSSLKMLISVECGRAEDQFILMKDGKLLPASESSVSTAGLQEGDLLLLVPASRENLAAVSSAVQNWTSTQTAENEQPGRIDFSSVRAPSNTTSVTQAESVRRAFLNGPPHLLPMLRQRNPELADAVNNPSRFEQIFEAQRARDQQQREDYMRTLNSDPLDPATQSHIEEMIRQRNLDENMESALENFPETFGQVSMLFVNCKVKGNPIKAFVDSGAQSTIMSEKCADRCHLERLIDKRWSGRAYGVGSQVIIGRIHSCEIEIGGALITTSFIVLKDQPLDLMIGLDMLKRHQCCIDLKRNLLVLDSGRVETPFLPESEIPFELAQVERSSTSGPDISVVYLTPDQRQKVNQLTSQGVPEPKAIYELRKHDWDVQAALVAYMSSDDAP